MAVSKGCPRRTLAVPPEHPDTKLIAISRTGEGRPGAWKEIGSSKKMSHESEEKMQEKMNPILQRDDNNNNNNKMLGLFSSFLTLIFLGDNFV